MLVPLALLAIGSIGAGWPFLHLFTGDGAVEFFRDSLKIGSDNKVLEDMEHLSFAVRVIPTVMMAGGLLVAVQFYHPPPGDSGAAGARTERALPLPAQCLVLRPDLRLPLCSPDAVARPAPVEGRRRVHHRRVRPRRRFRPRARRDPQRRAAADRLSLSLRLRHADRRRRLHHLVHVRGSATDGELADPLGRDLPAARRGAVHRPAARGRDRRAQCAVGRAVDHPHHLRDLAHSRLALRSRLGRLPVRRAAPLARRHHHLRHGRRRHLAAVRDPDHGADADFASWRAGRRSRAACANT